VRELLVDPLVRPALEPLAKPAQEALVRAAPLVPQRAVERAPVAWSVRVAQRQEQAARAWLPVAAVSRVQASVVRPPELVAQRAVQELAAQPQAQLEPAR
jgi:hypothetical protein